MTLVVFTVIGLAAAVFLRPYVGASNYERIAALFLFGVGIAGSLLFVLAALHVPLLPLTFMALLVAAVLVVAIHWRDAWRIVRSPFPRGDLLPLIVLVAPFLVVAWIGTITPLADYDGRLTWMPKAEAIVREASAHGPFFHGERGLNLHNRYPLLVPLDAALLMTLRISARHFFWLVPCAALVWCFAAVREHFGRPAAWVVAFVPWLPQIVAKSEGGALSAYVDLTVLAFLGAAVIVAFVENRDPAPWLAFLVLTKNEGVILALIVLAIVRARVRTIAWPAAAGVVLWWWRRSVPAAYDEQYEVLMRELPSRLHRLDDGILALARHALDPRDWGFFWIVALLAGVIALKRRFVKPFLVCIAAMAAYALTFAVTSWNIDELAGVAADRLLVHLLVPATLTIASLLQFATLGDLRTEKHGRGDGHEDLGIQDHQRPVGELLDGPAPGRGAQPAR